MDGLIAKTLAGRYNTKNYSFAKFKKLNRAGKFVVIFDGFDEMKHALSWADFDRLFYSAELRVAKKDLRFFEAINRALEIEPEERPLFFDDQPEIVELANRAGWDAAAFTSVRDVQHPRLRHLWT